MNRILFKEQADTYVMDARDPRFEHVRGVLRMTRGDCFDVGVVNGPVGKATITELNREEIRIKVSWGKVPPMPPPIYLVVGMCRPATARKILLTAPTMGVKGLYFIHAGRSDPAYSRSSLWTSGEWRDILIKGAEQAFDTHVPEVTICDSWQEFSKTLPDITHSQFVALDVYEGSQPISSVDFEQANAAVLAIGPERGWNDHDRKQLLQLGFKMTSLNERVLKLETAVVVGLTIILTRQGVF